MGTVAIAHQGASDSCRKGMQLNKLLRNDQGALRNGWWILIFLAVFIASQLQKGTGAVPSSSQLPLPDALRTNHSNPAMVLAAGVREQG